MKKAHGDHGVSNSKPSEVKQSPELALPERNEGPFGARTGVPSLTAAAGAAVGKEAVDRTGADCELGEVAAAPHAQGIKSELLALLALLRIQARAKPSQEAAKSEVKAAGPVCAASEKAVTPGESDGEAVMEEKVMSSSGDGVAMSTSVAEDLKLISKPAPGANLEEEPAAASDHELSMVPIEDLHQSEMQAPDRAIEAEAKLKEQPAATGEINANSDLGGVDAIETHHKQDAHDLQLSEVPNANSGLGGVEAMEAHHEQAAHDHHQLSELPVNVELQQMQALNLEAEANVKEKSAAPASSIGNYNKLCGDGCGDVPLAIASELPQHQAPVVEQDDNSMAPDMHMPSIETSDDLKKETTMYVKRGNDDDDDDATPQMKVQLHVLQREAQDEGAVVQQEICEAAAVDPIMAPTSPIVQDVAQVQDAAAIGTVTELPGNGTGLVIMISQMEKPSVSLGLPEVALAQAECSEGLPARPGANEGQPASTESAADVELKEAPTSRNTHIDNANNRSDEREPGEECGVMVKATCADDGADAVATAGGPPPGAAIDYKDLSDTSRFVMTELGLTSVSTDNSPRRAAASFPGYAGEPIPEGGDRGGTTAHGPGDIPVCKKCGQPETGSDDTIVCDRCDEGFHLGCVESDLPMGKDRARNVEQWLCGPCAEGNLSWRCQLSNTAGLAFTMRPEEDGSLDSAAAAEEEEEAATREGAQGRQGRGRPAKRAGVQQRGRPAWGRVATAASLTGNNAPQPTSFNVGARRRKTLIGNMKLSRPPNIHKPMSFNVEAGKRKISDMELSRPSQATRGEGGIAARDEEGHYGIATTRNALAAGSTNCSEVEGCLPKELAITQGDDMFVDVRAPDTSQAQPFIDKELPIVQGDDMRILESTSPMRVTEKKVKWQRKVLPPHEMEKDALEGLRGYLYLLTRCTYDLKGWTAHMQKKSNPHGRNKIYFRSPSGKSYTNRPAVAESFGIVCRRRVDDATYNVSASSSESGEIELTQGPRYRNVNHGAATKTSNRANHDDNSASERTISTSPAGSVSTLPRPSLNSRGVGSSNEVRVISKVIHSCGYHRVTEKYGKVWEAQKPCQAVQEPCHPTPTLNIVTAEKEGEGQLIKSSGQNIATPTPTSILPLEQHVRHSSATPQGTKGNVDLPVSFQNEMVQDIYDNPIDNEPIMDSVFVRPSTPVMVGSNYAENFERHHHPRTSMAPPQLPHQVAVTAPTSELPHQVAMAAPTSELPHQVAGSGVVPDAMDVAQLLHKSRCSIHHRDAAPNATPTLGKENLTNVVFPTPAVGCGAISAAPPRNTSIMIAATVAAPINIAMPVTGPGPAPPVSMPEPQQPEVAPPVAGAAGIAGVAQGQQQAPNLTESNNEMRFTWNMRMDPDMSVNFNSKWMRMNRRSKLKVPTNVTVPNGDSDKILYVDVPLEGTETHGARPDGVVTHGTAGPIFSKTQRGGGKNFKAPRPAGKLAKPLQPARTDHEASPARPPRGSKRSHALAAAQQEVAGDRLRRSTRTRTLEPLDEEEAAGTANDVEASVQLQVPVTVAGAGQSSSALPAAKRRKCVAAAGNHDHQQQQQAALDAGASGNASLPTVPVTAPAASAALPQRRGPGRPRKYPLPDAPGAAPVPRLNKQSAASKAAATRIAKALGSSRNAKSGGPRTTASAGTDLDDQPRAALARPGPAFRQQQEPEQLFMATAVKEEEPAANDDDSDKIFRLAMRCVRGEESADAEDTGRQSSLSVSRFSGQGRSYQEPVAQRPPASFSADGANKGRHKRDRSWFTQEQPDLQDSDGEMHPCAGRHRKSRREYEDLDLERMRRCRTNSDSETESDDDDDPEYVDMYHSSARRPKVHVPRDNWSAAASHGFDGSRIRSRSKSGQGVSAVQGAASLSREWVTARW